MSPRTDVKDDNISLELSQMGDKTFFLAMRKIRRQERFSGPRNERNILVNREWLGDLLKWEIATIEKLCQRCGGVEESEQYVKIGSTGVQIHQCDAIPLLG